MKFSREFTDYSSAYDCFDDIPEEFRFETYEGNMPDDVLEHFIEDIFESEDYDVDYLRLISNAGRSWRMFCQEHNVHHALATPELVDEWCSQLLEEVKKTTAHKNYLNIINLFYRFLKWNTEYPHLYNPVQFAIEEYETAAEIWRSCEIYYGDDNI